jgi:hypothetical protein
MKNYKVKFEDFEADKLSKNQQKAVRGGDGDDDPKPPKTDPGKGGTGGGGNG